MKYKEGDIIISKKNEKFIITDICSNRYLHVTNINNNKIFIYRFKEKDDCLLF
jgi:hypothetical protein